MNRPHPTTNHYRADEIAESFDGVDNSLYVKLYEIHSERQYNSTWKKFIAMQEGPEPLYGRPNEAEFMGDELALSKYWHMLDEKQQLTVNEICEKHESWLKKINEERES